MGRRLAQERQMARLAANAGGVSLGEDAASFTCTDGATKMPYEVLGKLELEVCMYSRLSFFCPVTIHLSRARACLCLCVCHVVCCVTRHVCVHSFFLNLWGGGAS